MIDAATARQPRVMRTLAASAAARSDLSIVRDSGGCTAARTAPRRAAHRSGMRMETSLDAVALFVADGGGPRRCPRQLRRRTRLARSLARDWCCNGGDHATLDAIRDWIGGGRLWRWRGGSHSLRELPGGNLGMRRRHSRARTARSSRRFMPRSPTTAVHEARRRLRAAWGSTRRSTDPRAARMNRAHRPRRAGA